MNKFSTFSSTCLPLFEQNIDTDQLVPKNFLLKIERTGFDEALFYNRRYNLDGSLKTNFILNKPEYKGSSILVTGANFGCGSSREHAPWALHEYGFKVIIAPSFADIFYNNCFKIGLLPIHFDRKIVSAIVKSATHNPEYSLTIDLTQQMVSDTQNINESFEVDEFRKYCLINGLDEIALTLQNKSKIAEFEVTRSNFFPSAKRV